MTVLEIERIAVLHQSIANKQFAPTYGSFPQLQHRQPSSEVVDVN